MFMYLTLCFPHVWGGRFADDTTVVGLITNNNKTAYREEVRALRVWCQENNLSLNVNKTKEMFVDSWRRWKVLSSSEKTEMDHPHRQRVEEGTTAPLQPQ